MTVTITKLHLAIAVIAIAVLAPATTAVAFHVFDDVSDDRFFSDAVEWAFDNGITTGTSATTFEPDANVTRGQNVTFAKRYDDNIVQPALTDLSSDIATNAAAIATNAAAIAAGTGVNFADGDQFLQLTDPPQFVRSVELVAPASGHVVVTASAYVAFGTPGFDRAVCSIISEGFNLDSAHFFAADDSGVLASTQTIPLSGTRTFSVPAGSTTFTLVCAKAGGAWILDSQITALYIPNLYAP